MNADELRNLSPSGPSLRARRSEKPPWQTVMETMLVSLQQLQSYSLPEDVRAQLEATVEKARQLPQLLSNETEQLRLAALYRVSHSLGNTLNLDEVLNQVMDAVIDLTGAERGFLMLLDTDTHELHLRAARDFEHETLQRKDAVSRTVLEMVVQSGNPVLTTDAQSDPRFARQESVMLHSLHSIMCVPLRSRGELIGVIYVDNRIVAGVFTNEDLNLLNAFASQAAIAIENARLYARTDQALTQRLAELETLTQIDRDLNARLDFDYIMEITRNWALRGTQASQAWIALGQPENGKLQIVAGPPDEFPAPLLMPDFDGELTAVEIAQPHGQTLLAAPIFHGGKLAGMIVVQKGGVMEHERLFLTRLAARAANAIENARLYEAVQQANQEKTRFISVVSHELRIPMTSIRGYTDLLRQQAVGPVNDQQRTFLETIRSNVDRMSALVSDLADISRIESGRLRLEPAWISVQKQVEETAFSLKPKLDEKKHTLILEIEKDLPSIYADPHRLGQVLTNLLSNACKYTPPEGILQIRCFRQGDQVTIEVHDNGIGIQPEDQKRLFEQFFRAEDQAVRQEQGWGLGLNVTKRLVELMQGQIGFSSQVGEGSTFWFTLPIQGEMT